MGYTFKQVAVEILEEAEKPLTITEIWDRANDKGLVEKLESSGKTPIKTLEAKIYTDCKSKMPSFAQVSKRPTLFTMKAKEGLYSEEKIQEIKDNIYSEEPDLVKSKTSKGFETKKYSERDMHKLLASFVKYDLYFKCYTKTVYHESSHKDKSGKNFWIHPDIVGVYYPHKDYEEETLELKKIMKDQAIKLFSFELKIKLDLANLRKYFFQTVSNSSWANEGYLVALEISQDSEFLEELKRLNSAFGIGVIELNPEKISDSNVLFFAKERDELDYETLDRLASNNSGFKEFIKDIVKDSEDFHKILRGEYDEVFNDDEQAQEYSIEKGMISK